MKGDFSRLRFGGMAYGQFNRVWMQQGRVQLDADWNAQQTIMARIAAQTMADLIGPAGGPADDLGFSISPRKALWLNGKHWFQVDRSVVPDATSGSFTLELSFLPAASGTLLDLPGAWRVAVIDKEDDADTAAPGGSPATDLLLEVSVGDNSWTFSQPLASDAYQSVSLVIDERLQAAYLNGETLALPTPTEQQPRASSADDLSSQPLYIGARYAGGAEATPASESGDSAAAGAGTSGKQTAKKKKPSKKNSMIALFEGGLDGLRTWSISLTRAEVAAFEGMDLGPTPYLVAAYRFAEPGLIHAKITNRAATDGLPIVTKGSELRLQPEEHTHGVWIGAGRYYVAGRLCENAIPMDFSGQPNYPQQGLALDPTTAPYQMFYLDVWERFVSALQAPEIHEPALQGIDTTGRSELVWQVKTLTAQDAAGLESAYAALTGAAGSAGELTVGFNDPIEPEMDNQLYRFEIHTAGWAERWPLSAAQIDAALAVSWDAQSATLSLTDAGAQDVFPGKRGVGRYFCLFDPSRTDATDDCLLAQINAVNAGRMTLSAHPSEALAEAKQLSLLPIAAFVWSRHNGSVTAPVSELQAAASGGAIAVLGSGGYNGFLSQVAVGDWVEFVNDESELLGEPGDWYQVERVEPASQRLALKAGGYAQAARLSAEASGNPLLRHWQSLDSSDNPPTYIPVSTAGKRLPDNIQLSFNGRFSVGDYWTLPVRGTPYNQVLWPQIGAHPLPLLAEGVEHHIAPLASVVVKGDSASQLDLEIEDQRRQFAALSLEPRQTSAAAGDDHAASDGSARANKEAGE